MVHADAIELQTELNCIVGILPRERTQQQPLRIRLRMELDLDGTASTGDLTASVDYAVIDQAVRFVARRGCFRLIESLASVLLKLVLLPPGPGEARAQVARASVQIEKPTVLQFSVPSVSLTRDAAWALAQAGEGEVVDLARLPEVVVMRWALAPGRSPETEEGLFVLGGIAGSLPQPLVAPGPCTLLQVVRR